MKKRIIKIIIYLFCTGVLAVALFYIWLSNVWRFSVDRSYYEDLTVRINSARPVSDSLATIYLKVNQTEKDNSLTEELFLKYGKALVTINFRNGKIHNCFCDELIYTLPIANDQGSRMYWPSGFEAFKTAFGVEAKTGDEACFNYYLRNQYEGISHEVRNYPYSFVGKSIDELSKEEYLEFLVIEKAPTLFNKFRNPERFMERKNALEKLLR